MRCYLTGDIRDSTKRLFTASLPTPNGLNVNRALLVSDVVECRMPAAPLSASTAHENRNDLTDCNVVFAPFANSKLTSAPTEFLAGF